MQTFQDTVSLEMWAFEDNVIATENAGAWSFVAPDGTLLNAPATLVPHAPVPRLGRSRRR